MMPGRMNPRQMNQMMKRLGINIKEIENVKKVVIETDSKKYIIDNAEVTIMDAQGQKTYQVTGRARIETREEKPEEEAIPQEDIGKSLFDFSGIANFLKEINILRAIIN